METGTFAAAGLRVTVCNDFAAAKTHSRNAAAIRGPCNVRTKAHQEQNMHVAFKRAAVIGAVTLVATPAAAAVEPPFIAGRYYEQRGATFCFGKNACEILFDKAPAGRTLLIQRVACSLETKPTVLLSASLMVTRSTQPTLRAMSLVPTPVSSRPSNGTTAHNYAIFQQAGFPVGTDAPKVAAFSLGSPTTSISIGCQLFGQLSP